MLDRYKMRKWRSEDEPNLERAGRALLRCGGAAANEDRHGFVEQGMLAVELLEGGHVVFTSRAKEAPV